MPVVELIDYRPGTGWVVDRCGELAVTHHGRVVVEARSPSAALGLDAEELPVSDAVKASGSFYDGVADGLLRIRSDGRLDAALAAATKQPVGESWRIGRKAGKDVCPLVAATMAFFALTSDAGSRSYAY